MPPPIMYQAPLEDPVPIQSARFSPEEGVLPAVLPPDSVPLPEPQATKLAARAILTANAKNLRSIFIKLPPHLLNH